MNKHMAVAALAAFSISLGGPAIASAMCGSCDMGAAKAQTCAAPAAETKSAEYACPMHPGVKSDKPGKCPTCGMNLEKQQAVSPSTMTAPGKAKGKHAPRKKAAASQGYTCPMHPEVKGGAKDRCPKCGMNLEKTQPEKK